MNYLTVNRPSNLITGVIASSYTPTDSKVGMFIPANAKALDAYYNWRKKNPGLCPDLGEIAARSATVLDFLTGSPKSLAKPHTENLNQRYREPALVQCRARAESIAVFITEHPDANVHDLHEQFQCGTTVARAYLDKHNITPVEASLSA